MPFRLPPYRIEATFTPLALTEIIDWGLALLHVPDHWKHTQGAGVRVALLDTGIDQSHPDLADAIDDAHDFTGGRAGAAQCNGDGTHVAGIAAARRNDRGV
ncbi:MAG: S8 family serine peptidase, partial [Pirellulales bacterium]